MFLENKISRSLTALVCTLFPVSTVFYISSGKCNTHSAWQRYHRVIGLNSLLLIGLCSKPWFPLAGRMCKFYDGIFDHWPITHCLWSVGHQRTNPKKNIVWMGPYAGVDHNLTFCPLQRRLQHIYHAIVDFYFYPQSGTYDLASEAATPLLSLGNYNPWVSYDCKKGG